MKNEKVQMQNGLPVSQMTIQQALELALRHHNAREFQQAESIYRQILRHDPNNAQALRLLGVLADQLGQHDVAIEMIERAIQLQPDDAIFHSDLGKAFAQAGRDEDAIRALTRAMQLEPNLATALNNLALIQENRGELEMSIAMLRRAIAIQPDFAELHWNLALVLLLSENFREGWSEYEWRWRLPIPPSIPRNFPQPLWDGTDLRGRTILLHAEQGFGDAIQFARYAPMVEMRGGRVLLEVPAALSTLMRSLAGVERVLVYGEELPAFDIHAPLLTLPKIFETTLETIPAQVPYIAAPSDRTEHWRERLGEKTSKRRIGLCWAGRATHARDRERSISQEAFASFAGVKDVTLYSLQKGPAAETLKLPLIDFTKELTDFAETAALIQQLDLIITVDTAVAHLAGALGKQVWTLLPFATDWRWMMNRSDSPWYPTMRLFRQERPGDWSTVIRRLVETDLQVI